MHRQSTSTAALVFAAFVQSVAMGSAQALPATEAQAMRLFQAGRFRDAARLYEGMRGEASAQSCNVGLCYAKLSDAASAVPAIESCLEGGAPWMEVVTRANYQELLSKLRARLASGRPATFPGGEGDPIAKGVFLIAVNAPLPEPSAPVAAPVPRPPTSVPLRAAELVAPIPPTVAASAPPLAAGPPAPSTPTISTPPAAPAPLAKAGTSPVYQGLGNSQAAPGKHAPSRPERGGGSEAAMVTGIPGILGAGIGFGFLVHKRALSQEIDALEAPPPGLTEITPEMSAALARLRGERATANRRAKISFLVGGLGLFASMIAAATSTDDPDDTGMYLVLSPGRAGIAGHF